MGDYEQFDVVAATYLPKRTDDLKPWAVEWLGVRTMWTASWIIEEGSYAGQWAFIPRHPFDEQLSKLPPFGWSPQCDLSDIVLENEVSNERHVTN